MDIDERLFMSGNGNLFILETLHKYLESRPSYFYLLWQRSTKKVDKQAAIVVVHEDEDECSENKWPRVE